MLQMARKPFMGPLGPRRQEGGLGIDFRAGINAPIHGLIILNLLGLIE
jgi:hypothetical protein